MCSDTLARFLKCVWQFWNIIHCAVEIVCLRNYNNKLMWYVNASDFRCKSSEKVESGEAHVRVVRPDPYGE